MIKGYTNLRIELEPSRLLLTNEDGIDLRIDQLSEGCRAVLSVIADIAKRLSIATPDSLDPLKEEAVILIDELDLHLHPKWQKEIAGNLKKTFPNCQLCAQLRVCSQAGGNPVYPRFSQPDNSESWDDVGNGI